MMIKMLLIMVFVDYDNTHIDYDNLDDCDDNDDAVDDDHHHINIIISTMMPLSDKCVYGISCPPHTSSSSDAELQHIYAICRWKIKARGEKLRDDEFQCYI